MTRQENIKNLKKAIIVFGKGMSEHSFDEKLDLLKGLIKELEMEQWMLEQTAKLKAV